MYSLLKLFKGFMNSKMDTFVKGDNFLRTISDFIFVRLSNLKLDIILKLNRGSEIFRKGSNWYMHSVSVIGT